MDFDVSPEQQVRLDALDQVVEACGGVDRSFAISRLGGHYAELDDKLGAAGLLDGAGLLDRVLIAERLAELGLPTTFGLRALLTDDEVGPLPDGPIAVQDTRRLGPVRFGALANTLIVLDGEQARVVALADGASSEVRSGFGYPYAQVHDVPRGRELPVSGALLRHRWQLALAAEIAGNASAGLARTAEHLGRRVQFRRPLSGFQALRHRLAEAAVSVEATRWMTRQAAWSGGASDTALAAVYAAGTAASLAVELTQLCGARSFALDFGLHVFTMRLEGLRLELGGPDRLAAESAGSLDTATP